MSGWLAKSRLAAGVMAVCLAGCAGGGDLTGRDQVLFDGTTLNQWQSSGSARWRVEEGVIVGGQEGDPRRSGLLFTEKTFSDFDLELEFMIDEHGKYNSGVYLRYRPQVSLGDTLQVNIGRGAAGEPVGLYRKAWLGKGDENDAIRKPGQWNHLRIRAVMARVQVWLNGQLIVDYTDPESPAIVPGAIAFQTYGTEGHAGWVKFRKIRIGEIAGRQ